MPSTTIKAAPGELPPVADLMAATGIVPSKSAARRVIAEGGAYLNNVKVTAEDAVPDERPAARALPGAAARQADRRRRRSTQGLSGDG